MEQALRFKAMYRTLGLTEEDVARFLQVTPRTVYAWIGGRVRIPYAAYKLLRIQLHYELPGDAWNGWHISAGRLYTPENHELRPQDFGWWGLLVRKAVMFTALYDSQTQSSPHVAGRTALGSAGVMRSVPRPGTAEFGPTGGAGRPAQPAGLDLSIGAYLDSSGTLGNVSCTKRAQNYESGRTTGAHLQNWGGRDQGWGWVGTVLQLGLQARAAGTGAPGGLPAAATQESRQAGQTGQCPAQVRWSLRFKGVR